MFFRTAALVAFATALMLGVSASNTARANDLYFGGMTYYGPTVAYGYDSGYSTSYYGPTTSTGWYTGYAPVATYPTYNYTPTYTYYAPTVDTSAATFGGTSAWTGVPAVGYGAGGYPYGGYGTAWGTPYRKMEYNSRWSRRGGYKVEYRVR